MKKGAKDAVERCKVGSKDETPLMDISSIRSVPALPTVLPPTDVLEVIIQRR